MTKNIFFVVGALISVQLISMEAPPAPIQEAPQAPQISFDDLPNDVKRLIVPLIASSKVKEVADTILALNRTNKFFHNFINTPAGFMSILKQMPYFANAIDLIDLLQKTNLPVVKNAEIVKVHANAHSHLRYGRKLFNAADENNVQKVKELLQHKTLNLNWEDDSDYTALYRACLNGNAQIVRLLLHAGANPNIDSDDGTPLMMAVDSGSVEIVKELISAGVDVNNRDSIRPEPLLLASDAGNIEIVKLFLNAGADVNIQEVYTKETALMGAAKHGHTEVVRLLLAAGANQCLRNAYDETARDIAVRLERKEIVELLDEALVSSPAVKREPEDVSPLLPPSKKPKTE